MEDEAAKLRIHLELLRDEYVKLQNKLASVEKQCQLAKAAAGQLSEDNFVSKLLKTVADLFNKELYSDLEVELDGHNIKAHKFVLAARSDSWGVPDLGKASKLDLSDVPYEVGHALLKWVYTDEIDVRTPDDSFLLTLLRAARKYQLLPLSDQCEQSLMSSVTVRNCIRYYQTAEEIGADILMNHCSQLISSHWDDFTSADFESMPASLTYAMFKNKSEFPLHTAVRTRREDVVFLYLVENDAKLPSKLDELDNRGDIPLDLALAGKMEGIARTLVKHKANVDRIDSKNLCLLHKAIKRGDEFAAKFLIDNKANVNALTSDSRQTALHLTACFDGKSTSPELMQGMANIANLLLKEGANVNAVDNKGYTALHTAVKQQNNEVFTVLLENSSIDLDRENIDGEPALWLALQHPLPPATSVSEDSFAGRLIKRGSSPSSVNSQTGNSLLHMCAEAGLEESGLFLLAHKSSTNHTNPRGETALHTACQHGLQRLVTNMLHCGANPNAQTTAPLEGYVEEEESEEEEPEPAAPPPPKPAPPVVVVKPQGTAAQGWDFKTQSLNRQVQDLNPFGEDDDDEDNGAGDNNNPFADNSNPFAENDDGNPFGNTDHQLHRNNPFVEPSPITSPVYEEPPPALPPKQKHKKPKQKKVPLFKQTPLHLAIVNRHRDVVDIFLKYKLEVTKSGNNIQVIPNFTVKDSRHQTVLALALWEGYHDIATRLIQGGASVNEIGQANKSLLHQAIERRDVDSCLFLLNHSIDVNSRTGVSGTTCLQVAIDKQLGAVVKRLCEKGANMNLMDNEGNCPLWQALEQGQEDIASILVQQGCNTDMWGPGPGGCHQTLLHKAIDENKEKAACFLIRSMCDANSARRPGPNGEGMEEARDGQTPLHLAATWGQESVIQCLLEQNADVNVQDSDGKTPLHVAIENQHPTIIALIMSHPGLNLMLRDSRGLTPFAAAMTTKNVKAAQAILAREPTAAEQYDTRGRNFLHTALMKNDVESVLFLIGVHVNVNSVTTDASRLTPLHLAVLSGNDFIVRNLLLAGARVNDLTPKKQTCLHLAAEKDHPTIASVLIENKIKFDAVDDALNNALHIAAQLGHLSTARVLLTESTINAEAVNMKGQNPMHCLGQYGKENAAAIFELFMECMPNYPIDKLDANGNTVLLLAYFNGNGHLCRAVVRAGAALGVVNRDGVSIFNAPVATKQLLFKLLDMLSAEPPWCEGETCLECGVKFGIRTRKHHCRHCGRLLCAKCSGKEMPIIKYNITSPTRVCDICFDVLTIGTT